MPALLGLEAWSRGAPISEEVQALIRMLGPSGTGGAPSPLGEASRWWRSKLLRVFRVFTFTTFGSMIGTWVGGLEIASNLF